MSSTFSLRTRAELVNVRKLAKAVIGILAEDITDQDELYEIYLALFEASTNVVRHAYAQREPGDIEMRITVHEGESLEMQIVDWGCGFPCESVQRKPVQSAQENGRGLMIMSGLCDEFHLTRNGTTNIVSMKRAVRNSSWKICA